MAGGFQQTRGTGTNTAFVTKFGAAVPPAVCSITSINPASGFTVGGTTVTINIANFTGFTGAGVTFDGVNAPKYTVNASSTVLTAIAPRHPVSGALVVGAVPLKVTALTGSCTKTYNYVLSACGNDLFFPSPAKGATGNFAYCMSLPGTVRVRVYNVIGDLAAKLEDVRPAGAGLSQLNTARLAPGVYLYRLEKDYGGGNSTTSTVKKFVVQH